MGLNGSPDIFQAIINDIMGDLPNVRAYLDDILITTAGSYEDHLQHVELVLQRLTDVGFAVNLRKSSFAVTEIDYLGYWITRRGIQPQPKKVEAIMRLTPPTTKRQLRRFLGMINYYRDMWRRRSHILAPLTALCSAKAKFIWHDKEQKAFEDIKAIISRETLLAYPDFSKDFHIYTDSSDYQLGAVIMQNDRPLAFYSRKLNSAQKRYTTGEQELLSIVETLKEFKNILLGQKLIVHTDHKNLLYQKMSTDRIIRWRLLIEEFGPTFLHIKGEKNVIADALSRLDANFNEKLPAEPTNDSMAYIFMTKADVKETDFPLSPTLIAKYQRLDNELKQRSTKSKSQNFNTKTIEGVEVITYQGKIYIPIQLQQRVRVAERCTKKLGVKDGHESEEDDFVVDNDDASNYGRVDDQDVLESEEEKCQADHSVFDLYEKLFKLRSNPLGLERFSREEKVQIELLQLLRDLNCPLKAFTLVLNWAAKSNASGHVFQMGCQPTREKVMKNLNERYNMNGLIPKEKQLYLPYSQRTVSVVFFDASEVFASLLSCPTLNQDENYLFDDSKDPFVAPSGDIITYF
ncbi:transposition [Fragilaria crotonensis]|nr:transposition [Fragilaria crotonensis]